MLHTLSLDQILGYREAFSIVDSNKDGKITIDELSVSMKNLGHNPTQDELQGIFNLIDADHNGTIDFSEFLTLVHMFNNPHSEEIDESFKDLDVDGDGYITADELRHVVGKLGEMLTVEEANALIRTADENGDGRISYREFVKMLS
jgi:calmodulin